jgi:hypothetical protein
MSGVLSAAARRAAARPAAARGAGRPGCAVVARRSPAAARAAAPAAAPATLTPQLRTPGGAAAPPPRRCRAAGQQRRAGVRVCALFGGLEKLLKGDPGEKTRSKYNSQVAAINALAPAVGALTDEQLRGKTAAFRVALANGTPLDALLPEAFAVRAPPHRASRPRRAAAPRRAVRARRAAAPRLRPPGAQRALSPPHARNTAHALPQPRFARRRWCARLRTACWGCARSTCSSSVA